MRNGRAFEVDVEPSLTPSSAATLADGAFEVFRKAATPLIVLSGATNLPLFAAAAGLVLFIRERGWAWGSVGYFVVLALLSIAVALAAWLRAVGTGAMAHAAARASAGQSAGVASSLGAALRAGAVLPLVCAVRLVAVSIGLAACFLPGLSVLGGLALAPHAAVLEGRGFGGSIGRALRLATTGITGLSAAGAVTAAVYLVGTLQLLLAVRLAEALTTLVLPTLPGAWLARPETPWLLLAAAKTLADPFVSAASATVFTDARIRADGLDLELRTQAVAGETPALLPEVAT